MAEKKNREINISDDELKWFAAAYVKNKFNAQATYMEFSAKFRRGCTTSTARVNGHRVMNKYREQISGYVEELMKKEQEKEIASAEEVLRFYTSVMRGDLTRKRCYVCHDSIEEREETPTVSESLKGADGLAKAYGMNKEKKEVDYGKRTLKAISEMSLNEKTSMVQDLLKEFGG